MKQSGNECTNEAKKRIKYEQEIRNSKESETIKEKRLKLLEKVGTDAYFSYFREDINPLKTIGGVDYIIISSDFMHKRLKNRFGLALSKLKIFLKKREDVK